jgi:hypothetical protein
MNREQENTSREVLNHVKNAIRKPFSFPGGYPVYTVLSDGELLCPDCARENFRQVVASTKEAEKDGFSDSWAASGAQVLWEGSEYCSHCSRLLESAYGETED